MYNVQQKGRIRYLAYISKQMDLIPNPSPKGEGNSPRK